MRARRDGAGLPDYGRLPGDRSWCRLAVLELEESLVDVIRRGQDAGEIAPGVDPARAGHALLAFYLGLYVLVRSGTGGKPVLRAVVRQVEALLPEPVRH